MECNLLKAHVRTYEMHKLLRTNLSQSLESCYLRVRTKVFDSLLTFLVAIAIAGNEFALLRSSYSLLYSLLVLYLGFLIAHTEQGSLQHIYVSLLDKVGEELKEECDDEQTDVHTVNIGIGSHDNLVVAQGVETILYIEGCLKEVEFLVLVYYLLGKSEAVERFTTK